MSRRTALGFGIVLVPSVVLVASVAYLALALPPAQSPEGPPVRPPPLSVQFPETSYAGDRIWYNFTVTEAQPNVSWASIHFQIQPGPLTKGDANWSLGVWNATGGIVAGFSDDSENWTTTSPARIVNGETIVLETDSPLVFGSLGSDWPSRGPGAWGVEIA